MLGTAKPASVIFFGTKGEDRNFFVSIYRNKFAVQKQRVSDGAMKNTHKGRQKTRKRAVRKVKQKSCDVREEEKILCSITTGDVEMRY